jgi:hypothetical protein
VDTRKSSALDCRNVKLGKPIMDMERYFVTREHEDLWWVSHRDTNLYSYPTEQEARLAALALAHDAAQTGASAMVVVMPPGVDATARSVRDVPKRAGS